MPATLENTDHRLASTQSHVPLPVSEASLDFNDLKKCFECLSEREFAILMWMAFGKSKSEIATMFSTNLSTIERDTSSLLDSLGVENQLGDGSLFWHWRLIVKKSGVSPCDVD